MLIKVGYLLQILNLFLNTTAIDKSKAMLFDLTLSYPEHLCATHRAYALSCRSAIFQGYRFGITHFPLGTAFNTICLHSLLLSSSKG